MKGIIFNVAERVVSDRWDPETWDAVLDRAGLVGAYSALGTYPDQDMVAILRAAADTLGVPVAHVLRVVGRDGYQHLANRYPDLSSRYASARDVLLHLDQVIHPQVKALNPEAIVPEFDASTAGNTVILRYRSERAMCHLAEGLVEGAADAHGDIVRVTQPTCRLNGDEECVLHVTFEVPGLTS
ncbi:guanylate cyclase-related protein [Euzebya pacifica]|uniref:Guanylate cyclase-related protein n=1 Tax=Euzebya pacifica TaxID=1608957 RepID=A0A346Y016_9ACTN|nr:heme NO-binding domain-containing protein [Euzebya pacifica]AXV07813.1 guanylate cyclase-related protein [Euzebya pacifica]